MLPDAAPGIAAVEAILPVSRETYPRLLMLVDLVTKWQKAENLIAPSTLPEIWTRHIADSAQLLPLFPAARRWLDLGSGGGFPGMVVAILLADSGGTVHLVERNARKCAFLRTAARETGAPAIVHQGRIEDVLSDWSEPVDVVTARALAPLPRLFELTSSLIGMDRPAAFLKGVDFQREIDEATQSWEFDLVIHPSRISEGGVILEVNRVVPKG